MRATPSQTVGPFLSIGLDWGADGADADGTSISGRVLDGAGDPVPDAMVEAWSGAAFARSLTDDAGGWAVVVPPAPYVAVHVFARGLLRHLTTRICFEETAIPAGVPAERRATLQPIAREDGYTFDIVIQGERETVFFDV